MTRQPLLSIGVPVYNSERYLRQTLDSLLSQTFGDFELIVSDNASTDGTEAICREYALRDSRIRYHRAAVNVGAAANYRRVFELSTAEYFKWHASDDLVEPTFAERCIDALRQSPDVVLAYSKTQMIDADGRRLSDVDQNIALDSASPSARFRHVVVNLGYCNVIYGVHRRDVLAQTKLMGAYMNSDSVLIGELALYGRFHEVSETLFSRRIHPAAYSSQAAVDERLNFYKPGQTARVAFVRWRTLGGYAQAILRSRVAPAEKCALWVNLLRVTSWQRRLLTREVWRRLAILFAALRHE